ncbi:MAG: GNAT family N-acetyltransferase [Pseudomonadota bacterium]
MSAPASAPDTAADDGVVIADESVDQPDVRALIAALDQLQRDLYPAESNHFVPLDVLAGDETIFLVARRDGVAIGCGAALRVNGGSDEGAYGEIKRMFVAPTARGLGLGARIVGALEVGLQADGITLARLETGIHQADAIRLYEKCGYRVRKAFGAYAKDPLSVFMEKALDAA